jgi:segregation and condensation protein B
MSDTSDDTKKNPAHYVSLIQDPFGLKTLEILDAQNIEDAQILEEELEESLDAAESEDAENEKDEPELVINTAESDADLARLSGALEKATEDNVREATDWVADPLAAAAEWAPDSAAAEAAAQLLSAQIAEDQALQAALAAETELETETASEADAVAADTVSVAMDLDEMQSSIEAILFMSDKPVSIEKLQAMLGPDLKHSLFQEAMTALIDRFAANSHGIEISQIAGGYQLRTKPGRAALAKKLARVQTQRLSSGAMETLAIVAYRQPVMKEDVDKIRGVDSSYFVRQLLDRKLIQISGRSELPGRPMVYSTTETFLALFGLKDLSAMPSLREIEQMVPTSQSGSDGDEDPRVKEMRRLVSHMKADVSTQLDYDPREDEKILQDIRERVKAIPTSTPYLEEQKALEKKAAEAPATPAEDTVPADRLI